MVRSIAVGRGPAGVTVGDGSVWVAGAIGHDVTRIDPSSGRVVATIHVGASAQSIAVGDGAVWVVGDER
jgi:streptogramin lyase